MTTIATEPKYHSLAQAARSLPSTKGSRPVHVATLTRWITQGVRAADGSVVRLQALLVPSGWKVSEEAIEVFLEALTRAATNKIRARAKLPTIPTSARAAAATGQHTDRAVGQGRNWHGLDSSGPAPTCQGRREPSSATGSTANLDIKSRDNLTFYIWRSRHGNLASFAVTAPECY